MQWGRLCANASLVASADELVIRNAAQSILAQSILSSLALIHIGQVLIKADEVIFFLSTVRLTVGGKPRVKETSCFFSLLRRVFLYLKENKTLTQSE